MELAEAIVDDINLGDSRLIDYQPGNATRYVLLITPVLGLKGRIKLGCIDNTYIINWIEHGSMVYHDTGYIAASYVSEKMKVTKGDAKAIAELIGRLYSIEHDRHLINGT